MLSVILAMIAALAVGAPAAAVEDDGARSTLSASGTVAPMRDVVPEVDERQCNVAERPRQIVLNLGIGGEEGQRCFGGTAGTMYIGKASVYSVFTGDYKGAIDCYNRLHHFGPNSLIYPIDICEHVTIMPDCWPATTALDDCRMSAARSRH